MRLFIFSPVVVSFSFSVQYHFESVFFLYMFHTLSLFPFQSNECAQAVV